MSVFVTVFTKEELMEALLPVFDKVYSADPESLPFRQAVDPDALRIPVSIILYTNLYDNIYPLLKPWSA